MPNRTLGFIGSGRITHIFLEGWSRAQKLPANITVSDPNAESLSKVKGRFSSVLTATDNAQAAAQDLVFLAVHPSAMAEVAAGIKSSLKPGALVVSLAPKFTVAKLTELLGEFARIARVIPNAPSVVNFGFNPVAFGPALSGADKAEITGLLAALGECPEVAEAKLDAYALLTARGPAFFWFQLYELRQIGESAGLTGEEAQAGLERMLGGALRTMAASGLSAEEVKNLIPVKPLADLESPITDVYRAGFAGSPPKTKP